MQRYSKQRELILENLVHRTDHPTAEMVYDSVREDIPKISLGTVYRNLKGLSEDRTILCFTIDGKDHFDGNANMHLHLCCTECGKIEDRMASDAEVRKLVPDYSNISNVIIQGKCKSCV